MADDADLSTAGGQRLLGRPVPHPRRTRVVQSKPETLTFSGEVSEGAILEVDFYDRWTADDEEDDWRRYALLVGGVDVWRTAMEFRARAPRHVSPITYASLALPDQAVAASGEVSFEVGTATYGRLVVGGVDLFAIIGERMAQSIYLSLSLTIPVEVDAPVLVTLAHPWTPRRPDGTAVARYMPGQQITLDPQMADRLDVAGYLVRP